MKGQNSASCSKGLTTAVSLSVWASELGWLGKTSSHIGEIVVAIPERLLVSSCWAKAQMRVLQAAFPLLLDLGESAGVCISRAG